MATYPSANSAVARDPTSRRLAQDRPDLRAAPGQPALSAAIGEQLTLDSRKLLSLRVTSAGLQHIALTPCHP